MRLPVFSPGFRLTDPYLWLLLCSVFITCLMSYVSLWMGWTEIVENFWYIPIIIACAGYIRKGFVASLIIIAGYMGFILHFTPDPVSVSDALFRVVFFLFVAVTVTYLSELRARSIAQVRESEDRYYTLFSNAILGIFRTSPAGRYLEMNPAFAHIAGYDTPEEMMASINDIGHQLYVHPEDRERIVELLISQGELHGYEAECLHRSGSSIWISMNAKAVRSDTNDLLWIEGTIEDITARKKAEAELAIKNEDLQSMLEELSGSEEELKQQLEEILSSQIEIEEREKKYQQLFESNIAGIALHEILCDQSGRPYDYRFLEVNRAFEDFTGLHAEDIIGKTACEVLPGIESYWIDTYGKVALTGETIHFENYSGDLGKYFDVTAYSTELGRFATLVLDVTPQKLSDIKIKENNAFLESLIDNAFGPIIVWSPDFRITRINRAGEFLVGRPAEELVGRSLDTLFPPDEAERSLRLIRTTLEGVRWETVELSIQHQDGSVKTVLWNSSTIYSTEGNNPIATIAQGRDVTLERRLEREKEETTIQIQENIAKLAILNDGIRNPLSIIALIADMTGDPSLSESIQAEISRIDEMVSSLDREWAHSEKILEYLKKHTQIGRSYASGSQAFSHALQSDTGTTRIDGNEEEGLLPQEIQAQLYSILDSIDALVYVADMKRYEILYINKKIRSLYGDSSGKKCYSFFHTDLDHPCPFCTNDRLIEGGTPTGVYRWEYYNPHLNRWYDCRDRVITWTDGRLVRLEIATDITDRKAAEQTIQESEEKFRRIVDTAQEGIWQMDRQMNTTYVNHRLTEILGYSAEEMFMKNVTYFMLPEDHAEHEARMEKRTQGFNDKYEQRFVRRDGSICWMQVSVTSLMDPNQGFMGSFAMLSDITQRKEVESALKESEEKFRTIIETSHYGIGIHQDGIIKYVNPFGSSILGYESPDDLIGKPAIDVVDIAFREMALERMVEVHTSTVSTIHEQFIRADGNRIEVEVRTAPFVLHNRPAVMVLFSKV